MKVDWNLFRYTFPFLLMLVILFLVALAFTVPAHGQEPDKDYRPAMNPGLPTCPETVQVQNEKVCWAEEPTQHPGSGFLVRKPASNRFLRVLNRIVKPAYDPDTLIAMAPLIVAVTLDAHSTSLLQARCFGCVELNPFLPNRPSNKQLLTYGGVYLFGQAHVIYFMKEYGRGIGDEEREKERLGLPFSRSQRWFFDNAFRIYALAPAGIHSWAAIHNYKLISCPSGFHKPATGGACVAN